MSDLLIKNGIIINSEDNCEITIKNGVFSPSAAESCATLDAKDNYVAPGLIDFHTHLYEYGYTSGMNAEQALIPAGVTCSADAGSCGASNFEGFSRFILDRATMPIKSFLNIAPEGFGPIQYHPECLDPVGYHPEKIRAVVEKHREKIVGLKLRLSRVSCAEHGMTPLEKTIEIAQDLGLPVMIHPTDPPGDMDEIFSLLRPGDIFSHVYHAIGCNIMDQQGNVKNAVRDAQERGVIFDVGCGKRHLCYDVAKRALDQGFLPDIISTDETISSMFLAPVHSLGYVMSIFLNLGMPLSEVIERVTKKPAAVLGTENEFGTLQIGKAGNVTIFRVREDKEVCFRDAYGNCVRGNKLFVPQATIINGVVRYSNIEFIV